MDRQSAHRFPYPTTTTNSATLATTTTTTTSTSSTQSGNTQTDHYAKLLAQFPVACHEELTRAFPERSQLKAFYKSLVKDDTPIHESSISDAIKAVSERRAELVNILENDVKRMLNDGLSIEKIQTYLKTAIKVAVPMDQRWLQARVETMVGRVISGLELNALLCDPTTTAKQVIAHLHKEGHPEGLTEFSDYVHTLDVYSSGTKRILSLLVDSKASDQQKIFWMASILAHTDISVDFPSTRDLAIHRWVTLVTPITKPMDDHTIILQAVGKAAAIADEMGKPQRLSNYLRNDAVDFVKSLADL